MGSAVEGHDDARLALERHQAGDLDQALEMYQRALKVRPDDIDLLSNFGVALRAADRTDEALDMYRRALEIDGKRADVWNNLGNALRSLSKTETARSAYEAAIRHAPAQPQYWASLGNLLREQGDPKRAIKIFRAGLARCANDQELLFNIGLASWDEHDFSGALTFYLRALTSDPQNSRLLHNIAAAYLKQHDNEKAQYFARKAIAIDDTVAETHAILGQALCALGRPGAAIQPLRHALSLEAENLSAHLGLARSLLLAGIFDEGWREYEWRWRREKKKRPVFDSTEWDGTPIPGKHLVVYAEQGFGDTIQFARYVPLLAAEGMKVHLYCQQELRRLLVRLPGLKSIFHKPSDAPTHDVNIALMSVPRVLGTTVETVPRHCPYLPATQSEAPKLGDGRLKVGLVWSGSSNHDNDVNRSIGFDRLSPLLSISNVSFYSLQKGPDEHVARRAEERGLLIDAGSRLRDFEDTARLLNDLDLVITVDTAVLHLAGALARPVWAMIPHAPDWRWMIGREDSVWYPTARLFRQTQPQSWHDVIDRIVRELTSLAAGRPHSSQ